MSDKLTMRSLTTSLVSSPILPVHPSDRRRGTFFFAAGVIEYKYALQTIVLMALILVPRVDAGPSEKSVFRLLLKGRRCVQNSNGKDTRCTFKIDPDLYFSITDSSHVEILKVREQGEYEIDLDLGEMCVVVTRGKNTAGDAPGEFVRQLDFSRLEEDVAYISTKTFGVVQSNYECYYFSRNLPKSRKSRR